MLSASNAPAVHAGNYYASGLERVLEGLARIGVNVPKEVLKAPKSPGRKKHSHVFSPIELAMLEWFEGRDYDQAQALIHYRPSRDEWKVIRVLDEENCPAEISFDMLCPTRKDAVAAVIQACEGDSIRLHRSPENSEALTVNIKGNDVLRIESVKLEPFDLAARDRVRSAFKGVRAYGSTKIRKRASRLPGFEHLAYEEALDDEVRVQSGCLLLGFPSNWAFAMRNALKQVGITVKQSQAQELVAVWFGAANWHQLIRHQDESNDHCEPVAVRYNSASGRQERYYQSPEEAILAVGKLLASYPEEVVCTHLGLNSDLRQVLFDGETKRELAAKEDGSLNWSSCVECGGAEYWRIEKQREPGLRQAAVRLLESCEIT